MIPALGAGRGLPLDADLYVALPGRAALAAAPARAAARGLTDLGIVAPVPPDPAELDAYVETVRTAATLARTRVHCGLELRLLPTGPALPAPLAPRLSRVDFIRLVPELTAYLTRSALVAVAALPVPLVLAGPFAADADLPALARACAGARVAIEVTERRSSPSVPAAVALHAAGATLVPGSGARTAADVGRYDHVRRVAAALAPGPHPAWSWWWLAPTGVAMLLNLRTAWRIPGRRPSDLLFAASLIPMELFLWLQIRCTAIAWYHVLLGRKRDGWSVQAKAEAGLGGGLGKIVGFLFGATIAAALIASGWTVLDPDWQRLALTYGWSCLAVVTICQTIGMAWRLVRPTRGFRP